jgi:hypothetical protein
MTHERPPSHETSADALRVDDRRDGLSEELGALVSRLHKQITGAAGTLDKALLMQLVSTSDRRAGVGELASRLSGFVARWSTRLQAINRDYLHDPRRPPLLDDACCLLVFEGLERDRFTLRSRWPATREEAELRQLAAIWAKPLPS